jgi:iron(III) transport system ATP-binding protein
MTAIVQMASAETTDSKLGWSAGIELDQVSKWFAQGQVALQSVSLRIPKGRLTSVLGPSGCGKSTLLRILAGLDRPDTGRVLMNGQDVTNWDAVRRGVGLVVQNYALFPHLSVLANVKFGLRRGGNGADAVNRQARRLLNMVGLEGFDHRSPGTLSGGQQQRVALARALAVEPEVLLLDEPLSNLDGGLRRHLREQICDLQRRMGLTVVYVTHDQTEALAVSDHLVVMNDGKVLQAGEPRPIYRCPEDATAAAMLGDAAFFTAEVVSPGVISFFGQPLPVPQAPQVGTCVQLMVRPEAWRVGPAGPGGFPGKILDRSYLGRVSEYRIELTWGEVRASVWGGHALLQLGAPVSVYVDAAGVSVRRASVPTGRDPPSNGR